MSWNDFSYTMGNLSNIFKFTNNVLSKDSGESFGTRLQNAGLELFGNSMALKNASRIRENTGSNIGYLGYYSAKGDATQAVQNTTNASLWAAQMYSPMYFDNLYSSAMYNRSMGTYCPSAFPQTDIGVFNNSFFRGYWA